MKILSLPGLFLVLIFSSCVTPQTINNNYLQNVGDTSGKDATALLPPIIQKDDLLSIRVYSRSHGVRPDVDAPYNLIDQQGAGSSASSEATTGFLVDRNGNIEYPQIGLLHVEGLTRDQLADTIKQRLEGQLTQPSVVVRFLNYRVTVLGEVGAPRTYTVQTERVNILEALGMAGDITEFGRKDNVKVIREINGQREIGTIDLTSKNMFESPYYRLQQNDVVLVEQTRRKLKQQDQQALVQQIGVFTSIAAAAALIITIIK
jgi:polysaccharide export outer membrane protein